ncbi:MAG: type II toxin-antitoxin system Phd/YefM family antitoxin [Candidatus Rokuibacteriota bacterium]
MKIAPVAEIKSRFSAYVDAAKEGPIVVTRNGRPVAVLVAAEGDEEVEDLLLAHSPRLRRILDASRRQIAEGAGLSHEEFWRRVESPV